MSFVWEEELLPIGSPTQWVPVIHLKKSWVSPNGAVDRSYNISVAWIKKEGKRRWALMLANNNAPQFFSTLKAAKAYAIASVVLGA